MGVAVLLFRTKNYSFGAFARTFGAYAREFLAFTHKILALLGNSEL
jgi:hypothetical protein